MEKLQIRCVDFIFAQFDYMVNHYTKNCSGEYFAFVGNYW